MPTDTQAPPTFDETPIPFTTCTLRHPHWMTPFLRSYARPLRDETRVSSGLVSRLEARRRSRMLTVQVTLAPRRPDETGEQRFVRLIDDRQHPFASAQMRDQLDPSSVPNVAGFATSETFVAIVGPYALDATSYGNHDIDLARDLRCETPPPSGDAPWTPVSLAEIRSEDGVASRVDMPGTIVSDQTFPDARASLARTQLHMAGEGLSMMREVRSELPTERGVESYRVAIYPTAPSLGFGNVGLERFAAMMALPEPRQVHLLGREDSTTMTSTAVVDGRLCQRSFSLEGEFIVMLDWCSSDEVARAPERQRLLAFRESLLRRSDEVDEHDGDEPDVLQQTRALRPVAPAVRRCLADVARVVDRGAGSTTPPTGASTMAPSLETEVLLIALVDERGIATTIVRIPSPTTEESRDEATQVPAPAAQCVADAVRHAAFGPQSAPTPVMLRCAMGGCLAELTP